MPADAPLLKLAATDDKDLAVVSGALQDAIVPIGDISFQPDDKRFLFVANRFRWEAGDGSGAGENAERINAGVTFSNVTDVKRRGIDFTARDNFLNLLAISCELDAGGDGPTVQLTFSGDTAIRLQTTGLLCHLEDFGEAWPTQWRPEHADQ
ncbi:MAG: DUF2948 family protein [Rhodospirillaceae bacterium]|jgi:hypothetical protein|nr:DUF2948 family protein [Rhodospirillaceae bacterium]MBT5943890.1 DUF2948 family protein [Rhodospirillaceae bacterium]MBT6404409.1 DUF2948 family protein [Rhodospirillaceae bacterium]MBT6537544.1 DUF2948 family protein [Rhodospirillaceae bacterium]MBT7361212.1 DUF2948 family protein [Rhodospirillaceae bacterium]